MRFRLSYDPLPEVIGDVTAPSICAKVDAPLSMNMDVLGQWHVAFVLCNVHFVRGVSSHLFSVYQSHCLLNCEHRPDVVALMSVLGCS